MPRRSNKQVAKILSSGASGNKEDDHSLAELDRKITLATEGFTTNKFCEMVLRDRNRLSKENALIVCDYIMAMKREINPSRYVIYVQFWYHLASYQQSASCKSYIRYHILCLLSS
jgi:hypothetical protein